MTATLLDINDAPQRPRPQLPAGSPPRVVPPKLADFASRVASAAASCSGAGGWSRARVVLSQLEMQPEQFDTFLEALDLCDTAGLIELRGDDSDPELRAA